MKNTYLFALSIASSALIALSLGGCSSNSNGTGGAGGGTGGGATSTSTTTSTSTSTSTSTPTSTSTSTSTSSGGNLPPAPALGTQIDRMGRPAINTALNHTFDTNAGTKGMAKDAYNADTDPTKWAANYGPEFAKNLAILDGLDTMCGNQLLAKQNLVKDRYSDAAGALADDRLWLKTDTDTCTTYLGVELNATKVFTNTDCGGRKLDYDPIDVSYSALAVGQPMGVTDGVAADADTKGTAFPYLAAPH